MNRVKSVEELEVFKNGHNLTLNIYKISKKFPAEEKFSLIQQIRRAAASICTNLMEGSHRLGEERIPAICWYSKGFSG